jgi:hypothetical protein
MVDINNGWDEYKKLILSQLEGLITEAKEQNRVTADIDKRLYLIEDNLSKMDTLLSVDYKTKFESYDALKWKIWGLSMGLAFIIPIILKIFFKV